MKNYKNLTGTILLIGLLLLPFASADSTTARLTWNVPSAISFTVAYGGTCSSTAIFFNERNAAIDGDANIDRNGYKILPQPTRTYTDANCQNGTDTAAIAITSTGNVNMDVNFEASASMTAGAVLKVWMSNGTHCGTNGLGGYQDVCSVTSATSPVTASTCKEFSGATATTSSRITSTLISADVNKICIAGDMNYYKGILPVGDTNVNINVQSSAS